jgi:hypothetical protein
VTELQRRIRAFRIHLMIRLAGYAALFGLVIALVVVIAAPWLRDSTGLPGYWLTILLPVIFPAIYVAYALFKRPNDLTVVLAADAWCGAEGSIVSAWELEREQPNSPFVKPVVLKAVNKLNQRRLPEPPLLRKMMIAVLVLLALVPLSRYVHAQMQEAEQEDKAEEEARKVDVPPKEAEKLAEDAGLAAELAKKLGATEQEKLADDVEEAARKAQAGGQDKERALREANSLVDRAEAQLEANDRREKAREELNNHEATRELAEAIEDVDSRKTSEAARELANDVFGKDGIDETKAEEIKRAVEEARNQSPQDPRLRRAAENVERLLDPKNLENAGKRREEMKEQMEGEGLDPEQVAAALEKLQQMDQKALEKALEELAKAASPLRDMDGSGKEMESLLEKLDAGEISPEEAKRLAEAARQLSERLELDAEALREMLKDGREFEGLDKAAEELVKKMGEQGQPSGPQEIPEWAKEAVPEEWAREWAKTEKPGGETRGTGGGERDPNDPNSKEGEGAGGGKGGKSNGGDPTKPVDGNGKEEGVDTTDTGEGDKDPNAKEERLDPNKAGDEKANRDATGRSSDSSGINTRDEEERLPRRYRDAARKYFER